MDVGAEEIGAIGRVIRLVAGRGAEVRRRLERLRWRDFLGRVA
jgi:hypothetical protein